MCAITGGEKLKEVKKMLQVMEHRAPDDSGLVDDGKFVIGMGRLAIIDLFSKGLCPYKEDNYVLVYNGEVYNAPELRRELEHKGYKFRTTSDTEVLLKSYKEWGLKFLDKLNGMFAFAIYNGHTIFMARDIAGEKPLYYREKDFAFASEAKALKSKPVENEFFNNFQHCLGETLYEGVKELLPAHYAVYDILMKRLFVQRYWEFKPRVIYEKSAEEELEWLLEDSIKLRTRSDVPYGLYYSGGLDSSLISSFHEFKSKYTYDEGTKKDFEKNISKIVYHLDFPVGSFSSYGLFKLAQMAAREVKVVLSGEGADELFGGYVRYLPISREEELRNKYSSYGELFNKNYSNYVSQYAYLTARTNDQEYYKKKMVSFFKNFDPITAMQYFDFKYVLPSLLQMGDRMAGMFGIENRCPFLDKRIIEFGLSLPNYLKINGLKTKVILRKIAERRGLNITEEKKGLIAPYNKWYGVKGYDRTNYFNFLKQKWQKFQ